MNANPAYPKMAAQVVSNNNFFRLGTRSEVLPIMVVITTAPTEIIVIKKPNCILLIPTSSIPNNEAYGAKKDVANPNTKFPSKSTGNIGMPHNISMVFLTPFPFGIITLPFYKITMSETSL